MTISGRMSWARTAACVTALAIPLALSGCTSGSSDPAPASVATTPDPAGGGSGAGAPTTLAPSTPGENGTAGSKLTISDGTPRVLMNGTTVDFGTNVTDLSWSPDGRLAAFIDGNGGLSVANPDGTGRVEVAKNPGGQTWSHPAWDVVPTGDKSGTPPHDYLVMTVAIAGVPNLERVDATAHDGAPARFDLEAQPSPTAPSIPQTANSWANGFGTRGAFAYQNGSGSAPTVYIYFDYLQPAVGVTITDAFEPAYLEADGTGASGFAVAFVRPAAGHGHIFIQAEIGATGNATPATQLTDLTPNATVNLSAPAWSPDGSQVAFATPSQVEIVSVDAPGKTAVVSATAGVPAYRP